MDSKTPTWWRKMTQINFFNTFIHPDSREYVQNVLDSTFLSEGKLVKEFENRLSSELGMVHPVAVNSGTSALHLALVLAGVGPGDEVILAPQTFVASALVICQVGAKPVFADIQYHTGNLDPLGVESRITSRTRAIMPVHWGGLPCDLDEILEVAERHGLVVIEDAAHAPGATYQGAAIGSISHLTCFSFQAIKHITTGDGGAVCCRDARIAEQALSRRWFSIDRARSPLSELGEREYDIEEVGFKYHLNDYSAALGLANLNGFSSRMERRRTLVARYLQELAQVDGLQHFQRPTDRESAHWLFGVHVERRIDFVRAMKSRGVPTSVGHIGIDHNSLFGGVRTDLTQQLKFNETQINLPIHDALTDEQVDHVIRSVKAGW